MLAITDIIGKRPRLNTDYYFTQGYKQEVQCLEAHEKLVEEAVRFQIESERAENLQIRQYLQYTYKLANQYVNHKWADSTPEDLRKDTKTRQVV